MVWPIFCFLAGKAGFRIWIRIGSGFFESLDPDPHFDTDSKFFLNFFHVKNTIFGKKTSPGSGSANI